MKEKFYITTSIAYANGEPHIGFALEVIQADVIARYRRIQGRDVFFLSGTDEHGAKVSRAASSAKMSVREFVDGISGKFNKLLSELNISNNDFIRTSDEKRHFPGVSEIWKRLERSGDIYKASYKGLYCVGHEAFITEKDLVDGKCQDHAKEPEVIEEENYFFRLSRYGDKIKQTISSGELKIFPESRKNEILSFLGKGLEDVSFSRPSKDIPWGIPVPGDPTQTMYVWCDALSNYITALGFGTQWTEISADDGSASGREKFWPADLHVIGKDILRFHAAIWPGMLLSSGLLLPKSIFAHGFITVGGRKMSKTLGNIVDPFDLIERFGADALRYYLLREVPVFEDGDFTEDKFLSAYNDNLAKGLGNYISRTSKMVENYFSGTISKPDPKRISEVPFKTTMNALNLEGSGNIEAFGVEYFILNFIRPKFEEHMENFRFSEALDTVWVLLGKLDGYIQTYEPFKLIKTDRLKTEVVLWEASLGALYVASMIAPFMPQTSEKIFKIFTASEDPKNWNSIKIFPHASLFPRK